MPYIEVSRVASSTMELVCAVRKVTQDLCMSPLEVILEVRAISRFGQFSLRSSAMSHNLYFRLVHQSPVNTVD